MPKKNKWTSRPRLLFKAAGQGSTVRFECELPLPQADAKGKGSLNTTLQAPQGKVSLQLCFMSDQIGEKVCDTENTALAAAAPRKLTVEHTNRRMGGHKLAVEIN